MESFPQMGVFRKAVICACVYQFFCVFSGSSLECSGITCGFGTEPNCSSDGQCACADQFSNITTRLLFGHYVQYCLKKCGDGTCPQKFVCTNYEHAPITLCECVNGYRRSDIGECVESCDIKKCGKGIFCTEKNFGAFCEGNCVRGYQNDSTGICKDFDECSGESACADKNHSVCINTAGSYRCDCIQGYTTTTTTAASSDLCEDIDKCLDGGICDDRDNTACVNSQGSFTCECLLGYDLDLTNTSCQDLNECSGESACADKKLSVCINTAGSYRCDCIKGYTTTTTASRDFCEDIDECLDGGICDDKDNTACVNSQGSFTCECLPGYALDLINTNCQDVDECEENPPACGEHSVCENHPGNYSCQCLEGYALNAERNSCGIFAQAASGPAVPITGSSVGVYVGVTFGVLAILGLTIGAILIRRRKNSHHQGASEGTNNMFPRQVEENSVTFEANENVNTANKDAVLPSEKREKENPAYAVNFNRGTPQSWTQNGGSVDAFYVNAKHTSKTEKKDGEYQNVFTVTPDKALKCDNTNGDSHYETMSLGLTSQLSDESRLDGNSEVLNITGDASGYRHGSDDYCTLGINAGNGNGNNDDQHAYSGLIMSDKDLQFQDADYYNIKN